MAGALIVGNDKEFFASEFLAGEPDAVDVRRSTDPRSLSALRRPT